ncbi:MAG TPA: PAS domain S-box protein, partial [Azospira sp.]|nr:PAS domain S-box protein [Azospira sp.]
MAPSHSGKAAASRTRGAARSGPVPDAVLLTDGSGRISSANLAASQLFGYAPDELLRMPLGRLLDDAPGAGGAPQVFLTRGHRQDGETFPVCVTTTPTSGAGDGCCLQIRFQDPLAQSGADVRDMAALHEALLEGVNYAFISVGLDGNIIFFNRAAQAMLGYTAAEVVGKHTPLLFHDAVEVQQMSERLSGELDLSVTSDMGVFYARESQGRVTEEEYTYVRKDGSRFPVLLSVMALWGGDGERRQIIGYLGVAADITERRKAEEKLRLSDEVFENSPEAIMITDADNRIVSVNPAFTRITGFGREEVVGANPNILRSGHHDSVFYRRMWESLGSKGVWEGEIWDRRKNGEVYPKWATINVLRDRRSNAVTHYLAMFSDISERKRAEETINFLAHHDPLTNLPNRFTLQARLQQALSDARRHETQVAVMFIDLDRFKVINDTLGHHVGDLLLIEVAKRISAAVRDTDTVARLGGDEFVVVLSGVTRAADAMQVALKINRMVAKPFWVADQELHTEASIGISLFPTDGDD